MAVYLDTPARGLDVVFRRKTLAMPADHIDCAAGVSIFVTRLWRYFHPRRDPIFAVYRLELTGEAQTISLGLFDKGEKLRNGDPGTDGPATGLLQPRQHLVGFDQPSFGVGLGSRDIPAFDRGHDHTTPALADSDRICRAASGGISAISRGGTAFGSIRRTCRSTSALSRPAPRSPRARRAVCS